MNGSGSEEMSADVLSGDRWSRWRWIASIAVVFGLQFLAIVYLSRHWQIPARPQPSGPRYGLLPSGAEHHLWLQLQDPMLFVLASPRGFSGRAWMRIADLSLDIPEWTNSVYWLSATNLGGSWLEFSKTNELVPRVVSRLIAPELTRFTIPDLPRRESSVRIEGDLSHRPLAGRMVVPAIVYRDVLSNSVVRVVVDRSGRTLSTLLIASSGYVVADQTALDLARQGRYEARAQAASEVITIGDLVFQWFTLPPTNSTEKAGF